MLTALMAAAFVCGCGGPMQPDELSRSIGTLESAAAEGALLAGDVARDRTKASFARAHARELGETVEHEAEKLSDADADGVVAARKARAVALAGRISQSLGDIQTSPSSEPTGAGAQRKLTHLKDDASSLAEGL
jgi:hypothetical protein